jgi:lincosamide nucleotidyltransferase A/C/D/E
VDGGWGIDALLGEETRAHSDLDLALERAALEDAAAALAEAGFEREEVAEPGLPARLVLRDAACRQVDLHPLVFDDHGNGWQELGEGAWGLYPADGLTGTGTIAGLPVRCISVELQLRHHLGWSWTQTDRADLERLAERFGLPLPPG